MLRNSTDCLETSGACEALPAQILLTCVSVVGGSGRVYKHRGRPAPAGDGLQGGPALCGARSGPPLLAFRLIWRPARGARGPGFPNGGPARAPVFAREAGRVGVGG